MIGALKIDHAPCGPVSVCAACKGLLIKYEIFKNPTVIWWSQNGNSSQHFSHFCL